MSVTLKDVAERAGVSRSAVSRTFTDGASVSDKMRKRVEQAAQELGYHPNALASSLTTGRTKLVGLVSNNFHNPYFLDVFAHFTQGLQDVGLRPLLVNLSDETDPANSMRMLTQYSVDGVIVASSTLPPSFSIAFQDAGVPVVNSFGRFSSAPVVPVVGIDNVEAGRMAARTLVARGYRRLGFMGGPKIATSTQDRFAGFVSELENYTDIDLSYSYADFYSFSAGRREMERLLIGSPAEAYFCGDDVLSIGALSAIQDAGLSVPQDIGIIGLNDMEMAGWQNINLTTIQQPLDQIVRVSIEIMIDMLSQSQKTYNPQSKVFPCRVIERGTLRPLGASQLA